MASNYWLKLYHEMLDDPKVMTLRHALRWRFIECLLVAGEMDEDGLLPETQNYAWRVRDSFEVVETELNELADAGLLSRNEGQWMVTKFADRQSAESAKERMRRMRERQRKQEYYQPETETERNGYGAVTKRNTDKIREDKDKDEIGAGVVFSTYENEIGTLSPIISQKIGDAIDEHGCQWVNDAISIAVRNNKRKWSYVSGILENWHRDGRHSGAKENGSDEAERAWAIVEEAFRKSDGTILKEHERVFAAVNAIGGWGQVKQSRDTDIPFVKKRFVKEYANGRS